MLYLSVTQLELVLEDPGDVVDGHLCANLSTSPLLYLFYCPDCLPLVNEIRDGGDNRRPAVCIEQFLLFLVDKVTLMLLRVKH